MRAYSDWMELFIDARNSGMSVDNMVTFIADNTADPRSRSSHSGMIAKGYHDSVKTWLEKKMANV